METLDHGSCALVSFKSHQGGGTKNKSNMNDERLKQLKSILEMLQIQRCNIFLRPSSKTA